MQSQEYGAHYPIFWLSFSAPVERRTSQYESKKTYCHLEAAGAIQKDGCWTWPVVNCGEELFDKLVWELAVDIMEEVGHTIDPTEATLCGSH